MIAWLDGARGFLPELLRQVAFRRFWLGQTISLVGDQVTVVALPLTAVLVLHSSPAEMGYLTAASMLPNLFFSLHAGAFVDRRGRRRRTMILADIGRAAVIVSVPVAYAFDRLTIDQMYVVAFATGLLSVVFTVSYPTLFTSLVGRDDYIAANSLTNGSRAFSGVAGPSLAGLLVQVLSAPGALVIDALSFLASAAFMTAIRVVEPPPVDHGEGSVMAGARFIARTPFLRAGLAASSCVNFFTFGFVALFLLYANRSLGVQPGTLGIVLGIGSVGALLGAAVTGRVARRIGIGPALVAGFLCFSAPLLLVPLAGSGERRTTILTLLLLAEFGSGFGVMMLDITIGAIFQAMVPDPLRARFSGAYITANYGVRTFGSLGAGLLATVVGVRETLWVAAIGSVLSVLWLLPSGVLRMRSCPRRRRWARSLTSRNLSTEPSTPSEGARTVDTLPLSKSPGGSCSEEACYCRCRRRAVGVARHRVCADDLAIGTDDVQPVGCGWHPHVHTLSVRHDRQDRSPGDHHDLVGGRQGEVVAGQRRARR